MYRCLALSVCWVGSSFAASANLKQEESLLQSQLIEMRIPIQEIYIALQSEPKDSARAFGLVRLLQQHMYIEQETRMKLSACRKLLDKEAQPDKRLQLFFAENI